jgi:4'-phosphopantetheinyl transferase
VAERERANPPRRAAHPQAARRLALGRWTAKSALSAWLNLPTDPESLSAIELRPSPSGEPKPFLHDRPVPVALSLSHSGDAGLCAIAPAGARVGCDVEKVEPRCGSFLTDYFTAAEQRLVAQTPVADRDRVLTLLWSAKESVLKALGCGLRADTRSVEVNPAAPVGEWSPLSATHTSGATFRGWWRESHGLARTIVADAQPLALFPLNSY